MRLIEKIELDQYYTHGSNKVHRIRWVGTYHLPRLSSAVTTRTCMYLEILSRPWFYLLVSVHILLGFKGSEQQNLQDVFPPS